MCTALIAHQVFEEWPLFVASNREEDRARAFSPPQREPHNDLQILAPRDELAGGTWIGASSLPLLAFVTNRTDHSPPDPAIRTRSRGLLVRDVLSAKSVDEALEMVERAVEQMSSAFNLVVGDCEQLFAVENTPAGLRLEKLSAGLHVVANGGRANDAAVGEVSHARELWTDLATPGHDPWKTGAQVLSCDEARGSLPPILKRTDPRGTVCSTLLGLNRDHSVRLDFCPTLPGDQPFERYVLEAHG